MKRKTALRAVIFDCVKRLVSFCDLRISMDREAALFVASALLACVIAINLDLCNLEQQRGRYFCICRAL